MVYATLQQKTALSESFFCSLLCVPLLGKGLPVLLLNLSILRDIWPYLPRKHDHVSTPSASWSTFTAMSSLWHLVCVDLCLPFGVHTCDVACLLPLRLNLSHDENKSDNVLKKNYKGEVSYVGTNCKCKIT